jgi:hypothetical protein
MCASHLPEQSVCFKLLRLLGELTIVSVMYGTGVQDLGSDLHGATEKHRIPVRIAFRAGARSNLVVSILSREECVLVIESSLSSS